MFSRVARFRGRSGWTLLGIVLGLVVAPVSALAAFTDVRVVGVFGNPPAAVTSANQLRVAEIDPAQIRHYRIGLNGGITCQSIAIPAGNSFLIRTIEIDTYNNPSPGPNSTVYVRASRDCAGSTVAEVTPLSTRQTDTIPFAPGIPVPAGGGFGVSVASGMGAAVHVTGYLMPSSAVPASTPAAQAKGTSKQATTR